MERIAAYADEVRRFVSLRVSNPSDAEDIAQETLFVACKKRDTFRNGNLKAWLFTIARNLVVDHHRQRSRFESLETTTTTGTSHEQSTATEPDAVQARCDSRDRLRCYLCLTERLALEEQVAVLLADVLGYRDKDSATEMGMSLPSFKLLLHFARTHLHGATGGHCDLVSPELPPKGNDVFNGNTRSLSLRTPVAEEEPPAKPVACCGGRANCSGIGTDGAACYSIAGGDRSCRLGIKCARLVPGLRSLRERLLNEMRDGLVCVAVAVGAWSKLASEWEVLAGMEFAGGLLPFL